MTSGSLVLTLTQTGRKIFFTSILPTGRNMLFIMLKHQIKQLEDEKKVSDAEDEKQNALIAEQAVKLNAQEGEIQSLRQSLVNVMAKLGMN